MSELNNMVTVVIPVLNEEEAIEQVIRDVKNADFHNILVVDGFSTDQTYSKAKNNGVQVVYQEGSGKTGAIETAINNVETPFLVFMDGDCTYDPQDITKIAHQLLYSDMIIGVRTIGRENIPFLNRFGNWVINFEFNILHGTNLKDVCSGMYGMRTSFAKNLEFITSGFDVEVEMASQASKIGVISEIPIHYNSRVGQQKLQPFRDGLQIFYSVIKFAWKNGNLGKRSYHRIHNDPHIK